MSSRANFPPSSFGPPPPTHPHYLPPQYAPQYVSYPQDIPPSVMYSPYGIPPQQVMSPYGSHPAYYMPAQHQALHPSAPPNELAMYQSLSLQRKRAREPEAIPSNKRRKAEQHGPPVEGVGGPLGLARGASPQEQRPIAMTNPTPSTPNFSRNSVIYSPCFCCLTDVRFYAMLCNELKRIATELDRPVNEKVRSSVWNYFYWITGSLSRDPLLSSSFLLPVLNPLQEKRKPHHQIH